MRKPVRAWFTVAAAVAAVATTVALSSGAVTQASTSAKAHHTATAAKKTSALAAYKPGAFKAWAGNHYPVHTHINCAYSSAMCTEVGDSQSVFGYYVGHDEPSMLFNSNVAGSGSHVRYNLILPKDPPNTNVNV